MCVLSVVSNPRWLIWLTAVIIVCLSIPCAHGQDTSFGGWRQAGDDLELKRVIVDPEALFSPEFLFVRTSLRRYRLGVVRAQAYGSNKDSVKTLCEKSKARLGINANFFDEYGKALGLVVSRGNMYQKVHNSGKTLTGIFQLTPVGISIVHRQDFKPDAALEAVQAGPRLVINGEAVHGLKNTLSHSRRAGVCIDKKSRLLFFVSSGWSGVGIGKLQQLLLSPDIDCKDALNLDGGGSVQFYLSKDLPSQAPWMEDIAIEGNENVPIMLALFER